MDEVYIMADMVAWGEVFGASLNTTKPRKTSHILQNPLSHFSIFGT
jgi:hypothetical protein